MQFCRYHISTSAHILCKVSSLMLPHIYHLHSLMHFCKDYCCLSYATLKPLVENRIQASNMYKKKTKQRQFRPSSTALLREPSPVDNRVHIRQSIIDELDLIKIRVDQVMLYVRATQSIHLHTICCRYCRVLRKRMKHTWYG